MTPLCAYLERVVILPFQLRQPHLSGFLRRAFDVDVGQLTEGATWVQRILRSSPPSRQHRRQRLSLRGSLGRRNESFWTRSVVGLRLPPARTVASASSTEGSWGLL